MTEVSESTDAGTTGMNAVTERIPRVVISASHEDSLITKPLPIVRAHSHEIERRVFARRPSRFANLPARRVPLTRVPARRVPAPLGLRVIVLVLFCMLFASASGVVAQRIQPKWFTSLENYVHPGLPAISTQHAQLLDRAVLISSTSAAITYAVPATSYSIVISIDHPCWFVVKSPAGGSLTLEELTMSPTASPMSIPVHGSSSIWVAAQARTITVTEGSKVLGTIKAPRVGVTYSFIPKP